TLAPAFSRSGSTFVGTWADQSATSLAGSISLPACGGPPTGAPAKGAPPAGVALAGEDGTAGGGCLTALLTRMASSTTVPIHAGTPTPRFAGSGGGTSAGRGVPWPARAI